LVKNRHAVIFDEEGSYVFNKVTGELNHIVDDGINYSMKVWIVPPKQIQAAKEHDANNQSFQRPAP